MPAKYIQFPSIYYNIRIYYVHTGSGMGIGLQILRISGFQTFFRVANIVSDVRCANECAYNNNNNIKLS